MRLRDAATRLLRMRLRDAAARFVRMRPDCLLKK
jgi:hypothetical protein